MYLDGHGQHSSFSSGITTVACTQTTSTLHLSYILVGPIMTNSSKPSDWLRFSQGQSGLEQKTAIATTSTCFNSMVLPLIPTLPISDWWGWCDQENDVCAGAKEEEKFHSLHCLILNSETLQGHNSTAPWLVLTLPLLITIDPPTKAYHAKLDTEIAVWTLLSADWEIHTSNLQPGITSWSQLQSPNQ